MAERTLTEAAATESTHRMTYQGYLALPHGGRLIEWVNGEVVYHMPPTTLHQKIVSYLDKVLGLFVDFFGLGQLLPAATEMKLVPDGPSREPDLLFVASANLGRLGSNRLDGPADLVIEIVSDDSVARDYDDKFIEYQEGGVQEYWIIDPRPRRSRALFYQRDAAGVFRAVEPEGGVYRSRVIPRFWLKVAWLWQMPDPLLTLGEIAGFPEPVLAELRAQKRLR